MEMRGERAAVFSCAGQMTETTDPYPMLTETVPPVNACAYMTELVGTAHPLSTTVPPEGITKLFALFAELASGPRDTYALTAPPFWITRFLMYPVDGAVQIAAEEVMLVATVSHVAAIAIRLLVVRRWRRPAKDAASVR